MHNFDIPKEEVEQIFEDVIFPHMTKGATQKDQKQAFIIGGQPGSGKSTLAKDILTANPDTVFINGDDLRAYHPNYYFYLMRDEENAADLTQSVCNFWIESLITKCADCGFDVMIEGTFRKPDVPLKTAQLLRDKGYLVNCVALSTSYELSLRSIEMRYEEIKKLGGFARFTKRESHDEAYRNAAPTLEQLTSSSFFSKFYVYSRLADGFIKKVFDTHNQREILQAFEVGRGMIVSAENSMTPKGPR